MSNPAKPLTTLQHTIQYVCNRWASDAFRQAKRDAMIASTRPHGPDAAQERRFWRMASALELTRAKNWRRMALRSVSLGARTTAREGLAPSRAQYEGGAL